MVERNIQTYNAKAGTIIEYVKELTPEWHDRRYQGIGGSDIGTLLMLNGKYKSRLELWMEKTGQKDTWSPTNRYMHWGREMENLVADNWQYYDGDPETYIQNKEQGRLLRKVRRANGVVSHPDIPWLYVNLDREVEADGNFNLVTAEPYPHRSFIECKTIAASASRKYKYGIPQNYVAQGFQGLICSGFEYGEIAVLVMDTRELNVHPILKNDDEAQRLISYSKKFWYDQVLPARELVKKRKDCEAKGDWTGAQILQGEIDTLEPGPENTEAYREFMKTRYQSEPLRADGTLEDLQNAVAMEFYKGIINMSNDAILKHDNYLRYRMREFEELDFGRNGMVTYRQNEKGDRSLRTTGLNYPINYDIGQNFLKLEVPEVYQ